MTGNENAPPQDIEPDASANKADPNDLEMAEAYLASGLIAEATELFTKYLKSTQAARASMGMAICAYHRENFHEALAYLQCLATIDPTYPDLANLAGAVMFRLGLIEEARSQFRDAVDCAPDNPVPLLNLADIEYQMGNVNACLEAIDKALALDPQYADAIAMRDRIEQNNAKQESDPESERKNSQPRRRYKPEPEAAPPAVY
jgi:tetratricopeptide (TPR) repeat protein